MNLRPACDSIIRFGKKYSTKILAAGAIISEVVGFWFMHKQAPKVQKKLEELPPDAKLVDKLKVAGPLYLPAALMLLTSSGCIIGGCAVGEAKLAAMTNIAMATDAALTRCEKKLTETLGPEKAQQFHEEMAKDVMRECPVTSDRIIATTHGVDAFFDPLSGRYFTSSANYIQKAAAEVNNSIMTSYDMWATVNDWYAALDIAPVKLGGLCGWNPDHPIKVEIDWSTPLDDRPCGTLVYFESPKLHNNVDCTHIW